MLREWSIPEVEHLDLDAGAYSAYEFYAVAYSPKKNLLVSGGSGIFSRGAEARDINSGRLLYKLNGINEGIQAINFNKDEKYLALGGAATGQIYVWSMEKNCLEHVFEKHTGVMSVVFSSNNLLASAGMGDTTICLWDLTTRKRIAELKDENQTGFIFSIAFSPDGKNLASGGSDSVIRIWDVESKKLLRSMSWSTSPIFSIAYSFDGQYLSSAGGAYTVSAKDNDNTIRIWSTKDDSSIKIIEAIVQQHSKGGHQWIYQHAISPNNRWVAAVSLNGSIGIWDIASGERLIALKGDGQPMRCVTWALNSAGLFLVTGGEQRPLRSWKVSEENNKLNIVLSWSSSQSSLMLIDLNITQASGIENKQYKLLRQRGAIDGRDDSTQLHDLYLSKNYSEKNVLSWCDNGFVNISRKLFLDSLYHFEYATLIDKECAVAFYGRAFAYEKLDLLEQSLKYYDCTLQLSPRFKEALYNKSAVLAKLDRYDEAHVSLDKAIDLDPDDQCLWYGKGLLFLKEKNFSKALDCFKQALILDPKYLLAWLGSGETLRLLKNMSEAIECFNTVSNLISTDGLPETFFWSQQGSRLKLKGNQCYAESFYCYEKALSLNSKEKNVNYGKGDLLVCMGQYRESLDCYIKELELFPDDFIITYRIGYIYFCLGELEKAQQYYNSLLNTDPTYGSYRGALGFLGYISLAQKNCEEAEKYFEKIFTLPETDYHHFAWFGKGLIALTKKEYKNAKECFERSEETCLITDTDYVDEYIAEARISAMLGFIEISESVLRKILRLNPTSIEILQEMERLSLATKDEILRKNNLISSILKHEHLNLVKVSFENESDLKLFELGKYFQILTLVEEPYSNKSFIVPQPYINKNLFNISDEIIIKDIDIFINSEKSISFEESKILEKNFKQQLVLAEKGDPVAQFNVGECYERGQGVERDYHNAMKWYEKARDNKNVKAIVALGEIYRNGLGGILKDYTKAITYYQEAILFKDPRALSGMGIILEDGLGVSINISSAIELYMLAAEQKYPFALSYLGIVFSDGNSVVKKDGIEAKKWYQQAFLEFTKRALDKDPIMLTGLGWCYHYGTGVQKNTFKAVELYQEAIRAGYLKAKIHLSSICFGQILVNSMVVNVKKIHKVLDLIESSEQKTIFIKNTEATLPNIPFSVPEIKKTEIGLENSNKDSLKNNIIEIPLKPLEDKSEKDKMIKNSDENKIIEVEPIVFSTAARFVQSGEKNQVLDNNKNDQEDSKDKKCCGGCLII